MKYLLLPLSILLTINNLYSKPLELEVEAESAILVNAKTGCILYEKNAHKVQYPASITKIVTGITALNKNLDLSQIISVEQEAIVSISTDVKRKNNYSQPSYWLETNSTHVGLKRGEEISLKDLIYCMMIVSANDASNVIAQHVGGTIPAFVQLMNDHVKQLGCSKTNFCNPHGLHHPDHVTTAYDMALITKDALQNPQFATIVMTPKYLRPKTNKQESSPIVQTNLLLRQGKFFYDKAIGVKTGHTSAAQNTFVGAAKNNNRTLIAVLLKCKDRQTIFADAIKLFEKAFSESKVEKKIISQGDQAYTQTIEGATKPLKTFTKENLAYQFYPSEEPKAKCLLYWNKLSAPILKDQKVGEIVLELDGKITKRVDLYSQEEVQATWGQWLKNFIY